MLADYYSRGAVAAAQVIAGFDEPWFREKLERTPVGFSVGHSAPSQEGLALAGMLVRLLARLYPALAITGETSQTHPLSSLARRINPRIELVEKAEIGVAIGNGAPFDTTIYAGCRGWDGLLSELESQPIGRSKNPFGGGVAACLAAAWLFRRIFVSSHHAEPPIRLSALAGDLVAGPPTRPSHPGTLHGDTVLVGAGAIGEAAIWSLARSPLAGRLRVVDMEDVELGNLQRYVLTEHSDTDRSKVDIAASTDSSLTIIPHRQALDQFLMTEGYRWDRMLLALDSARDRVAAQAALPRAVANAWTQPGDLGVSLHSRFGGEGACVSCLYLPDAQSKNEDELVAEALGVPQLQLQIRTLLATGQGVDLSLLQTIAEAIGQPAEALASYQGRPIRDLYVEGFCGGAVIPVGDAGRLAHTATNVHVPLAHQSALAGLLLAGSLFREANGEPPEVTDVTRVDVLRPPGQFPRQPMRAARDGRCICDDPDFVEAYESKYNQPLG